MIFILIGGSIGAILFTGSKSKINDLKIEFRKNYSSVLLGSSIMYLAYSVMLYALNISRMSYAGTARELTIIVGMIWSYFFLKEKITKLRIFSVIVIFFGAVIISFSN